MSDQPHRPGRSGFIHPFTNLQAHAERGAMVIERGEGVHVQDDRGRWYLEGMSGLWCCSLGFSEPRLIEAARRQLGRLPYYHSFTHKGVDVAFELTDKLLGLAPAPMSGAFYTNSGSEANDSAVKMVWYYNNARGRPEKKKIIAREKGYHGVTVATASLTGLPHLHARFDLPLARMLHTDAPHAYRSAAPDESEEDFASRLADNLDRLIETEGPETVGAFIAEPIIGAGGASAPPASYFDKIQAVLDRHDVLLIADEVVCGFGRTGRMWGSQTYGMHPDIITCAKGLTAGYQPLGAVLISEPIHAALIAQSGELGTFGHGFTYSAHPVCAAVALEALTIYEERDMPARAGELGTRLIDGLRGFADHPLVGEVVGEGLIAGVELVADPASRRAFPAAEKVGAFLFEAAQKRGVILRAMGDRIGFCPPFIADESHIDQIVETFGAALDDTLAEVRRRGLVGGAAA